MVRRNVSIRVESFEVLVLVNVIVLLLHLLTVVLFAVLIPTLASDFSATITKRGLRFETQPGDDLSVEAIEHSIFSFNIAWVLLASEVLTVSAHVARLWALLWKPRWYLDRVLSGYNVFVWPEFIVTSALPILVLVWLQGELDLAVSLEQALLFSVVNAFGWIIEARLWRQRQRPGAVTDWWFDVWLPFWAAGAVALLPILVAAAQFLFSAIVSGNTPLSIYGAVLGTLFQYLAWFPQIFAFQRRAEKHESEFFAKRPWAWNALYQVSSLTTKMTINWFFLGGVISRS